MNSNLKKSLIVNGIAILVFAVLLALDLIIKRWAEVTVPNFALIPGVIEFTLYFNDGMGFSIFSGNPTMMKVVVAITVCLMIAIAVVFVLLKNDKIFLKIVLCLIEAGAIGNLVDRIMMFTGNLAGVRDMVDLSFFGFGICNFADFYVVIGGVLLMVYLLFMGDDPIIPVFKKKDKKA